MKQLWACVRVIGMWCGGAAWAQLPQIEHYSGDLWSRPALTGVWGAYATPSRRKASTSTSISFTACRV